MGRTKHKTNKGKNSYENNRTVLSVALNMHYVYCLLFLQFYASLFFAGQNPLVFRRKGRPKYVSFMASGTARSWWYSCTSSMVEASLWKNLFQRLHLHWRFFKPSQLWPSNYGSAVAASSWYCKPHFLERLNSWEQSACPSLCPSLKLVPPTQLPCNFGIY